MFLPGQFNVGVDVAVLSLILEVCWLPTYLPIDLRQVQPKLPWPRQPQINSSFHSPWPGHGSYETPP
jgi:hypothetical protein